MLDFTNGWIYNKGEIERIQGLQPKPFLHLYGANTPQRKTVLLYNAERKVHGTFTHLVQNDNDCVAHGSAHALNAVKSVEIVNGDAEEWKGSTARPPIYWITRNDPKLGNGMFRGQGGSTVGWAAECFKTVGSVIEGVYGSVDVSNYSKASALKYADSLPPKDIYDACSAHKIKTISSISSINDACYSLENGYPLIVAGINAFTSKRDKNGFCRIDPNNSWAHCQAALGVRYDIEGIFIINSWPDYLSGPLGLEAPEGGYWISFSDFYDCFIGNRNSETFSISQFDGYPLQKIDWGLC